MSPVYSQQQGEIFILFVCLFRGLIKLHAFLKDNSSTSIDKRMSSGGVVNNESKKQVLTMKVTKHVLKINNFNNKSAEI